jgi:hypothetical protein
MKEIWENFDKSQVGIRALVGACEQIRMDTQKLKAAVAKYEEKTHEQQSKENT